MQPAYDAAAIRRLEATAMETCPDGALMQRAAHGLAIIAAAELRRRYGFVYGARVVILVGPGNNGGDALFAGARLARRGASVLAVRALGRPHAQGLAALLAAGGTMAELEDLGAVAPGTQLMSEPEIDLVIDGILGIGGRAGLPPAVVELAASLAGWRVPTIAVDLPSGIETDTGAVPAASVAATRTVTFGARKPCHLVEPARSRCGLVEVVEIGLDTSAEPPSLLSWDLDDLAAQWPFPDQDSDKYSRGLVGIDSGSEDYPGAAILNTYGAVYAGAGMVRFLGPPTAAVVIRAQLPNVMFSPGRVQAHLLGSGWGDREGGERAVEEAVGSGLPVLVDADGLRFLPAELPESCLLTPHAGELARLLDCTRAEVQADPVAAVKAAAARTGATVLLKGASQFVAGPHAATVAVALPGPAWTAQAGSGDTLAGVCAALLAAGQSAREAAVLGASLQAATAASVPGPLPPHDLARRGAEVLGRLQQRRAELLAKPWANDSQLVR